MYVSANVSVRISGPPGHFISELHKPHHTKNSATWTGAQISAQILPSPFPDIITVRSTHTIPTSPRKTKPKHTHTLPRPCTVRNSPQLIRNYRLYRRFQIRICANSCRRLPYKPILSPRQPRLDPRKLVATLTAVLGSSSAALMVRPAGRADLSPATSRSSPAPDAASRRVRRAGRKRAFCVCATPRPRLCA